MHKEEIVVNTTQIIKEFADKNGIKTSIAKKQVSSLLDLIGYHISRPKTRVKLRNIGSFSWVTREPTSKRMPSGQYIEVPAKEKLVFNCSSKV